MSPPRKGPSAAGVAAELDARPLSTRSVIASLLLGTPGAAMAGSAIVRWCALFGISDGTARVALSRMTAGGELRSEAGSYALAGPLLERRSFQDWSLHPRLLRWDGSWAFEVVTDPRRSARDRASLRTAMARRRLRELREGVWLRPANLPPESAPASALGVTSAQCSAFSARPDGDPLTLTETLFDPAAWARRARRLLPRIEAVTSALGAGDHSRLAEGFATGAAVLVHVRADPLLPAALVAADFPGDALRAAYLRYQTVYRREARSWLQATAAQPSSPRKRA